jgi:energy-coupling factor transporter ATP-binding protein EcfA2
MLKFLVERIKDRSLFLHWRMTPIMPDTIINDVFLLAEAFITQTSKCVFLTGKAGTGKTTFLRHVKSITTKNTVVVAPTGVAAVHAGGTTIHSFFQLPFSPFVPEVLQGQHGASDWSDRYQLIRDLRIESEKRHLFKSLDLLIIDEVSMMRCDVLDAIDTVLRHFRKREDIPFGGVQVLLIGDLFQLPPIIQDNEWAILSKYYKSPFFFHARVISEACPVYLELKTIYRQSDSAFIDILNRIRNNEVTNDDLEFLNKRYQPGFEPAASTGYVTLTTHNHTAEQINVRALENLPGETYKFTGTIEGDFSDRSFPTDKILQLKVGAQVMFIKNDMERVRRYYNGKIGVVTSIDHDSIFVSFPGEYDMLEVQKETWRNVRYTYQHSSGRIEEEVLGTFTQYAIRLAWAVTIHKSQGLTFDKVIIDAHRSFAPGQVYVAFSRCTSLDGIVMLSPLKRSSIMTDPEVIAFSKSVVNDSEAMVILQDERLRNHLNRLLNKFEWRGFEDEIVRLREMLLKKKFKEKAEAETLMSAMLQAVEAQKEVAMKFKRQLRQAFEERNFSFLKKRVDAGVSFFCTRLEEDILNPLMEHGLKLQGKKRVKKYRETVESLIAFTRSWASQLALASDMAERLEEGQKEKSPHQEDAGFENT